MATHFAAAPCRLWGRMPERALVALSQAIKPLSTVVSFMNTGAHPDDELSALLAFCSRGLGVRTISVIATRGEGGQNRVGHEHGRALGVVRTRELEEASRITGVSLRILSEDLDDPIYDFGFCRTPEEALSRWGAQRTLERLVRVIREERPDVVMASFRDEYGQHGHHRAVTRLTIDAARLASDPQAFPEQLRAGLKPWAVRKVYLPANPGGGSGEVYLSTEPGEPTVVVDVGEFDEVLGVSYEQLGEASRFLHRSQGMGRMVAPGPRHVYAQLVYRTAPAGQPHRQGRKRVRERSMFDGLPYTVADLAGSLPDGYETIAAALKRIQDSIDAVQAAFPERAQVVKAVHRAMAQVRALLADLEGSGLPEPIADDLRFRLGVKERELATASAAAALLVADLRASRYEVVRGQAVDVELRAFNGGRMPLSNVRLELSAPAGWFVGSAAAKEDPAAGEMGPSLSYNQTLRRAFRLTVRADAPLFHPYRQPRLSGLVRYDVDGVEVAVPVELPHPLAVLPDLSLAVEPEALLVNTLDPARPLPASVLVRNHHAAGVEAVVRLNVPRDWQVDPAEVRLDLGPGAAERVSFTLHPAPDISPGTYRLTATAGFRGVAVSDTVRIIEHDHIGRTYMIVPAEVRVTAFEWKTAPVRVGYVDSGFDSVAKRLQQMGFDVRLLGKHDLLFGDLSLYDTIVLGIYAYGARPELLEANGRLLSYVMNGGHLVVQLHRPLDNWDPDRLPPYRLVIGRPSFNWRVTDEEAPVTVLDLANPVFNWPNRIGDEDWHGWVKDRGLYFPMEWAPDYTLLIAMSDPGRERLKGGMLLARYGKGTYLYTSLTWYYQLDQYVPGAYRIVANMVSFPAHGRQKGQ